MKITVWNEYTDIQRNNKEISSIYPKGFHEAIADGLRKVDGFEVRTATIEQPEQGLSTEVLDNTDVLLWWGHSLHGQVTDENAKRVVDYVNRGMGIIFLHSAHKSKPFASLLGTSGSLSWREAGEKEIVWTVNPSHPIAKDIPEHFVLEHEEMYGEPFGIPEPLETVFIGWFKGGNVFRSGVTYIRGNGRIFYFQPGHETYRNFYDANVLKVLSNACVWANPVKRMENLTCPNQQPLEPLE